MSESTKPTAKYTQPLKERPRMERLAHLETLLAKQYTGKQIVQMLTDRWGIEERQAYYDLREVYERIAQDAKLDSDIRIARARRMWARRIQRNERHAEKAMAKEVWGAAASFESAANYAADRLMKLDGLYAPKKIELSGSVGMNVGISIQLNAVIGILDAEGLAALDIVTRQIEAAKAKGLLAPIEEPAAAKDPIDAAMDAEFEDKPA